jgi:hypothetical protein
VVNYRNAPTYYEFAKVVARWLKENMDLSFKYNTINTIVHNVPKL